MVCHLRIDCGKVKIYTIKPKATTKITISYIHHDQVRLIKGGNERNLVSYFKINQHNSSYI